MRDDSEERVSGQTGVEWTLIAFVVGCFTVASGFAIAIDGANVAGEQFHIGACIFMGGLVLCVVSRVIAGLMRVTSTYGESRSRGQRAPGLLARMHDRGLHSVACLEEVSERFNEPLNGVRGAWARFEVYLRGALSR